MFEEEDMVILHQRKDIFRTGTCNKHKYKKIGPCKIWRKIYDHAYMLDLLDNFDISLIFNIVDLYDSHEGTNDDDVRTTVECKEQLLFKSIEKVEEILI